MNKTAHYEGLPYAYHVTRDRGAYRIQFEGRFGPSCVVRNPKNIEAEAQRLLEIHIRHALKRFDERIIHAFGILAKDA